MHRDPSLPPVRRPVEAEVDRVVCASVVSNLQGVYAEMERIRESAMRHNRRAHIHTALLCRSGWFVYWMEGPTQPLRELLDRVGQDSRHRSPVVLHHSRGRRYLPTRWSMMLDASPEPATGFARRVMEIREHLKGGHQYPPTSVVRRLVAPFRLLDAANADPEAYFRIGVCSADSSRAFELVRAMAKQHGAAPETRRYAGEEDLDSGSDYVDFLEDGQPCRLIAVSRASLQHGVRRAFMPDWPYLLMLFGENGKRNDALMERICLASKEIPSFPQLLGVSADAQVHERMTAAARDAGLVYRSLGIMECDQYSDIWRAMSTQLKATRPPIVSQWDLPEPAWTT